MLHEGNKHFNQASEGWSTYCPITRKKKNIWNTEFFDLNVSFDLVAE